MTSSRAMALRDAAVRRRDAIHRSSAAGRIDIDARVHAEALGRLEGFIRAFELVLHIGDPNPDAVIQDLLDRA